MKPAHTFSFFRTTSDIFASSQRKDSAPFCLTSFLSLSLLRDSRRRELLPDWTIGDATPGSTCMFPGTLPRRLGSQRVSPHPLYNGLIRDTLPGAAKSPDFARTFVWIYNREKPALHHHSPFEERRLIKNQPDSNKSARFLQISKSLSNQQDSPESARLPRISPTPESDGYTPTASHHRAIALHSLPQLLGLSRVALSIVEGLSRLLRVCGLLILRARSPCLVIVV